MPAHALERGSAMNPLANNPSSQHLVRSMDDAYREMEPEHKGRSLLFLSATRSSATGLNPTAPAASVAGTGAALKKPGAPGASGNAALARNSSPHFISRRQWMTVAILTFVNLINYMDRFTIAGILRDVQLQYQMNDSQAGALHTAFVICYMLFAPLFGYLGDRYSRRIIMAVGVSVWVVATLVGSFMPDYTSFLLMRAIVGIGEASYSTIAPTIISDMFVKEARSTMLAIFYFAIPVGSGLGYVTGKGLSDLFGDWHYALRGTPLLGIVAIFLIILVMIEPPRGEAEGHDHLKATTYKDDLLSLLSNRSFMLSTLGFTCVTFCTGALAWWGPKFIEDAVLSVEVEVQHRQVDVGSVALIFGAVTMVSGMMGVPMGAFLSTWLREKYPRSDPIICGLGLFVSSLFFVAFFLTRSNIMLGFALIFMGEVALNLNWSIVADILLYVVVPTRRSTAEALQILLSHLLGDAGSPYLIGLISEGLKNQTVTAAEYCSHLKDPWLVLNETGSTRCQVSLDYYSMQYALVGNVIVEIMGGIFFLLAAFFVIKDRARVFDYLSEHTMTAATEKLSSPEERDVMIQLNNDDLSSSSSASDDDDYATIPHLKPIVMLKPLSSGSSSSSSSSCEIMKHSAHPGV